MTSFDVALLHCSATCRSGIPPADFFQQLAQAK
jgi:hypothetical protein